MQGRIVRGIAGFYYVNAEDGFTYTCRAKGIFRKEQIKPLVGDRVIITFLGTFDKDGEREGSIEEILERTNELIRPRVSNVDQALVVFAAKKPDPNLNLLDRFLVMMEQKEIECVICFNKDDFSSEEDRLFYRRIYEPCGYTVMFTSAREGAGIEELRRLLHGRTTVMAGPSGVGKSSVINLLCPDASRQTGEISEKIERGRHTTRESQLLAMGENSYMVDTPGFTSLELFVSEDRELRWLFPEMRRYEGRCRFQGCLHLDEPDCAFKAALEAGEAGRERYDSYRQFCQEIRARKRY